MVLYRPVAVIVTCVLQCVRGSRGSGKDVASRRRVKTGQSVGR